MQPKVFCSLFHLRLYEDTVNRKCYWSHVCKAVFSLVTPAYTLTPSVCNLQTWLVNTQFHLYFLFSSGFVLFLTGDMLIVEEDQTRPKMSPAFTKHGAPSYIRETLPVLTRAVVPADNSCLFTSVYYVVEGGVLNPACAPEMRHLIAQIVASNPDFYSKAILGKTNQEYCDWIKRDDTWGGAIEISILSKFYQCEICVVDTQTVRIDRFGEDAGYTKRVLLIYDGIHYDPLQRVFPNPDTPPLTIFSSNDDIVLVQALELADEARSKRQFTDVNRFTLRCMVCQKGLTGHAEARDHAKETGHTNFGEV